MRIYIQVPRNKTNADDLLKLKDAAQFVKNV